MSFTASASRGERAAGPRLRTRGTASWAGRFRLGAGAVSAGALAAVTALTPAAPAGAATSSAATSSPATARSGPAGDGRARYALSLRAMPAGAVSFGRSRHGHLTVHVRMFGLTPGSAHQVDLVRPGEFRPVRFAALTASSTGRADRVLRSGFAGLVPAGSRLVVRMGTAGDPVSTEPIALTRRLRQPGHRTHRLVAVEVSPGGVSYGTPRGHATISYNARRQTLTVIVSASGVTPGPHAAHIHLGSCQSQGAVKYMLKDLVASRRGRINRAVRIFTNVTSPIPAHGWYLNIHQGNSGNILSNGQPTIYFRPLICANIRTGAIAPILRAGDVVTGVRGTGHGKVVLTGGEATGDGTQNDPFLYQGRLTSGAAGANVSILTPPFRGVTSATFYGPDTHAFNPRLIPDGKVRAVGSYISSSAPPGVVNQGMIYLGPVNGSHGSWTTADVPSDGARTVGHVRACPRHRTTCFVMDTIAHSTMGDLVVGNYDLNPAARGGVISANAFIYHLTRHRWTLLRLNGSMSSQTTLYGIWQDGGSSSPKYTLAGGSMTGGRKRAFLMNYNERTGRFGAPKYFSFGHGPALVTHFEGITGVPGGFNLVAGSTAQASSMAFVPVSRDGRFGAARWHPVNVAASPLCASGCSLVTGNAVYKDHVMGLFLAAGAAFPGTYLATLPSR